MRPRPVLITTIIVILIVLGAALFGLYWLFGILFGRLDSVDSDATKIAISIVVASLGAAITMIVGKIMEMRMRHKLDLRVRKISVYEQVIKKVVPATFPQSSGQRKMENRQLRKIYAECSETLIIWASSPVLSAWDDFRTFAWNKDNKEDTIYAYMKFDEFLKALRRDVGNDNYFLEDGELLRMLNADIDEIVEVVDP